MNEADQPRISVDRTRDLRLAGVGSAPSAPICRRPRPPLRPPEACSWGRRRESRETPAPRAPDREPQCDVVAIVARTRSIPPPASTWGEPGDADVETNSKDHTATRANTRRAERTSGYSDEETLRPLTKVSATELLPDGRSGRESSRRRRREPTNAPTHTATRAPTKTPTETSTDDPRARAHEHFHDAPATTPTGDPPRSVRRARSPQAPTVTRPPAHKIAVQSSFSATLGGVASA